MDGISHIKAILLSIGRGIKLLPLALPGLLLAAPAQAMQMSGFSWSAFGYAYAVFIATIIATWLMYWLMRAQLVLHPGVTTHRYCAGIVVLTAFYIAATFMDQMLGAPRGTALPYEAIPQAVAVLVLHARAYRQQEPAAILLAVALLFASAVVGLLLYFGGQYWPSLPEPRPGQWATAFGAVFLSTYTLIRNSNTMYAFRKGVSAVVANRLPKTGDPDSGKGWFPLPQTVAIVVASLVIATLIQVVEGGSLATLLFVGVLGDTAIVLGLTVLATLLPTGLYLWRYRSRLPDFQWLVWVIWSTTAFGSLYARYLGHLASA